MHELDAAISFFSSYQVPKQNNFPRKMSKYKESIIGSYDYSINDNNFYKNNDNNGIIS